MSRATIIFSSIIFLSFVFCVFSSAKESYITANDAESMLVYFGEFVENSSLSDDEKFDLRFYFSDMLYFFGVFIDNDEHHFRITEAFIQTVRDRSPSEILVRAEYASRVRVWRDGGGSSIDELNEHLDKPEGFVFPGRESPYFWGDFEGIKGIRGPAQSHR